MMGNKNLPVPGTPGTTIPFQNLLEGRQEEILMGDKNPAPPSHSKPPRRETRADYDGRQDLAISRDPWHNYECFGTNLEPLQ